jgi:hypothetical protein
LEMGRRERRIVDMAEDVVDWISQDGFRMD